MATYNYLQYQKKNNDLILIKLSDGPRYGQKDRRTDGQMDESDFIGRCPTNVERPINGIKTITKDIKI